MKGKYIVAVDFDNTLVSIEHDNNGEEIFTIMNNSIKEKMDSLYYSGKVVFILNTCRTDEYLDRALKFIEDNDLPIFYRHNNNKIEADVYIDNKNIFCEGIDWPSIFDYIEGKVENND